MDSDSASEETNAASKQKNRGKKRKRKDSGSSTDIEDNLPEHMLEVEKNLHASAIKNNLDDVSVKKILKKVVTNDHVLALVKLREEEEESKGVQEPSLQPKLTRAKAKELKLMSPKSAPWNLELTPIKHIPVKTRPEVTALISKELPEDEDDDEYHPTHEDVQSDDDQTLESCSDVDSQPATPATPRTQALDSPNIVTDGPFKVPQGLQTPVRRKLIIEEEATIALRTRSKINLSATTIEHIESSFVPPDEVPTPVVDEIWNQFLEECMNPEVSRNEDDEEADPEYNVAADPDAHDEDDDALRGPLIKISKKELNDLVTELFGIIPDGSVDDVLADNLAKDVLTDANNGQVPTHWDGKQEPVSDEEVNQQTQPNIITEKRDSTIRFSIGKTELEDEYIEIRDETVSRDVEIEMRAQSVPVTRKTLSKSPVKAINVEIEEHNVDAPESPQRAMPAALRHALAPEPSTTVHVNIDDTTKILPEQLQLLQQQLRQHVQLCASNFLQLFVNPFHWKLAPTYREYLDQFNKMLESCPNSIVNVCNLKPAIELMDTWEATVSEDTPENTKLVDFIKKEADRSRRRFRQNCLYVGEFPEMIKQVVANSPVFLYPYLLPAMPYRADTNRKFGYRRSEDELIALGLDQFWRYIEENPSMFKRSRGFTPPHTRWGLMHACELLCKYMFPWKTPRLLLCHIGRMRKEKDNPIYKLFTSQEITPVKHTLLPFNPTLTLYEQPEHEMPRIWARYLSKSSKRFRDHIYKRKYSGKPPDGVPLSLNPDRPYKVPLPIDFTKSILTNRVYYDEPGQDKVDVEVRNPHLINNQINIIPVNGGGVGNVPGAQILQGVSLVTLNNSAIAVSNPSEAATAENTQIALRSNESQVKPSKGPMLTISAGVIMGTADSDDSNEETTTQTSNNTVTSKLIPVANKVAPENALVSNNGVPGNHMLPGVSTNATKNVNMFQVVPTSRGMYLIPLTAQNTNTVNSINGPITTTQENNMNRPITSTLVNKTPENKLLDDVMKMIDELKNHCQCCILLRKITKRQSKITDYFKPKDNKNDCECTNKVYPMISKRLKLLVHNYKSRFWCEQSNVKQMIEALSDSKNSGNRREISKEEDNYSLEDVAFVTSYQMKLITRGLLIKNVYTKKRINNTFSQFDPTADDPIELAGKVNEMFNIELIDLYKEFMGFLTAEQADKMDRFKDYFLQNCLKDLLKRIEEQIKDAEKKTLILKKLSLLFSDNISTSCEICAKLLTNLIGYPKLAEYVFTLFPHRVNGKGRDRLKSKNSNIPSQKSSQQHNNMPNVLRKQNLSTTPQEQTSDQPTSNKKSQIEVANVNNEENKQITDDNEMMETEDQHKELTICNETAARDYEADNSSCGEDNDETKSKTDRRKSTPEEKEYESGVHNYYETEITISKTEVQEHSDSTSMSPLVMSEDEPVKAEAPEWKREEDKLILEVLLQYLTPQERKEKTILEILEEKNVYQMITESLPHKSIDDVKDRVMYLLEILVMSEY